MNPSGEPPSASGAGLMSAFEELDEALLTPARRWYMTNQMVEVNPQVHGGLVARATAFLAMGRPWEVHAARRRTATCEAALERPPPRGAPSVAKCGGVPLVSE